MSDETAQAIEDAISAHVADEIGGLLSGWVLSISVASADDAQATSYEHMSSQQPVHTTLGLLDMATREFRHLSSGEGQW